MRRERAQPHRLQDLLRDDHLARAIAVGLGRERHANGVADAFLQQHGHGGGRRDDALRAHAGLGEPEVQRVVAPRGQVAVDRIRSCTRETLHDRMMRSRGKPELHRARGAFQRADSMSASRITRPRAAAARASRCRPSCARAARRSRRPQFTPMRTGLPYSTAFSIMVANCSSRFLPWPTLPGLMRYLSSTARTRDPGSAACGR